MNAQYTLGYSKGNTGGSNEATTAGNNARALGRLRLRQRLQQLRRPPHLQPQRCSTRFPATGALDRRLDGRRHRQRAQRPAGAGADRPQRHRLRRRRRASSGTTPAADRTAVINTPGRRRSRSTRRPDLVPGVDPFIKDGGLLFLNPAAFATPAPGTFGNLERNSIHGPGFQQIDMVDREADRRRPRARTSSSGPRSSTCSTHDNFANPVGHAAECAADRRRRARRRQANRVQPGQPLHVGGGGHVRPADQTVGTTVGLGTNRQVQFAFRFNF